MGDDAAAVGAARRAGRSLGDLLPSVAGAAATLEPELAEVRVHGIAHHTREVSDGTLFVALPGSHTDGHEFAAEAVARGAVAVLAEKQLDDITTVPVVRVPDARRALAELAVAWYDRPAEQLHLVGITGTAGKTSVLSMLDAMLSRAGMPIGTIGSLGIGIGGVRDDTGFTAPDALTLQRALARIRDAGLKTAAMEVTSHALMQRRVETIELDLGVFVNLVPFEHVDYHHTFRGYVDAKVRFFDHVKPAAPLIYNADDRAVRGVVRGRDVRAIACGRSRVACVRIEPDVVTAERTTLQLNVRRPLPRPAGDALPPARLPLELRLLGRTNVTNAALAATAALCLGADADAIAAALRDFPPPRRRMELKRIGGVLVLDDTVGHPDSLSAVMEVVPRLGGRRLHIVFGMRGSRGRRINRRLGEALGIWADRLRPAALLVTTSDDAADERNRVQPAEREAFLAGLRQSGVAYQEQPSCRAAVELVMNGVHDGDVVLLLGAQGMDRGAEFAAVAAGRDTAR
jgi:UDP-N-acetylmuramoyl-L-alanyl-D-glutamate--2,6-diaminopimelate ligase